MKKKSGYFDLFPEEDLTSVFVDEEDNPPAPSDFLEFVCCDCGIRFSFDPPEDPTSSHGACKVCGSKNWQILDPQKVPVA